MQAMWTRLKRDEAHQVLERLSGHRDAIVFSREATEVSVRDLPFYAGWRLYRLINYATMPTFSLTYLGNGAEFHSLDGTANPIYAVNAKAPVMLSVHNVISYLDFFFSNVQGSEGDIFLIKDPQKMPFMASLTASQQNTITTSFRPLQVGGIENGVFRITGTLYYGGGLIASAIHVQADGRLGFQDQQLLLTGIHFPHSPYSQSWLEG